MLKGRVVLLLASLLLVAIAAGTAMAGDIVTVPTANQLKAGEIDVADYYIFVDRSSLVAPLNQLDIDFVRAQTLYCGLTDKVELDVHRYDADNPAGIPPLAVHTIFNATYLVREEDAKGPNVVVGARDISRAYDNTSYFISAAKTLNPPIGGPPTEPIFRLHVSVGTEDNTLFGEGRHDGLFGGVQVVVRPADPFVGLIGLYDGQDVITGVTYVPKDGWPTLKGGTFGGHWWAGVSYTFNAK
jgi:hypothetical protein